MRIKRKSRSILGLSPKYGYAVDEFLAARLVGSQFPQWAHLPIVAVDSSGLDNAMFRLGSDMAVRMPRVSDAAARLEKELRWLPTMAPLLPLPIPVSLASGAAGEGYPYIWSVYRWFEGGSLLDEPISNMSVAAGELGRFVAALRQIDATDGPPSARGIPINQRDGLVREAIDILYENDESGKDFAITAWESVLRVSPWQGKPTWTHGDLMPGNLVGCNGELTAVIDFGALGVGDPACDMLVAWTLLSSQSRAVFREEANVDDPTWQRGRGWGLCFGLTVASHFEESNPVLAGVGRYAMNEALADF